jgi:hypothetical protein
VGRRHLACARSLRCAGKILLEPGTTDRIDTEMKLAGNPVTKENVDAFAKNWEKRLPK